MKKTITFFSCSIILLSTLTSLNSCNTNEINLPNIELAISADNNLAGIDDQKYILDSNGRMTVQLCYLSDDLNIDTYLNNEDKIIPALFKEKTYYLSNKQKKVLLIL